MKFEYIAVGAFIVGMTILNNVLPQYLPKRDNPDDPNKIISLDVKGKFLNIRQGYFLFQDTSFKGIASLEFMPDDLGYINLSRHHRRTVMNNYIRLLVSTKFSQEKIFSDEMKPDLEMHPTLGLRYLGYDRQFDDEKYVDFDENGKLRSIFRCGRDRPDEPNRHPQCANYFRYDENIVIKIGYSKANFLPRWREIQEKTIRIMNGEGPIKQAEK